jgi:hypothetical protein
MKSTIEEELYYEDLTPNKKIPQFIKITITHPTYGLFYLPVYYLALPPDRKRSPQAQKITPPGPKTSPFSVYPAPLGNIIHPKRLV